MSKVPGILERRRAGTVLASSHAPRRLLAIIVEDEHAVARAGQSDDPRKSGVTILEHELGCLRREQKELGGESRHVITQMLVSRD